MKYLHVFIRYVKISFHYLRKEKAKVRQNILLFSIFLCISSAIWLINTLRKNYTTTLAYPVRFINFPKDKLSTGELPSFLFLLVKSSGYTVIQNKITPPKIPFVIDVNAYALKRNSNSTSLYYILTDYILPEIQNQTPSELKVLNVTPDTLYFHFDKVHLKKVPVVPAVKIDFQKQYSLSDLPIVKPDSIFIYGPKSIVDTIQCIKTEQSHFKNVNKTIQRRFELQKVFNLTYAVKTVFISIPVERYTEAYINIPVEAKNVPDSLQLKIIPEYVKVTCNVGLSNYEKIQPYYFKAKVDYSSIDTKQGKKLKVEIDEYPRMVSHIKVYPQKVDYIIKKK